MNGLSQIAESIRMWFTRSTDIDDGDYVLRANGMCDLIQMVFADTQ